MGNQAGRLAYRRPQKIWRLRDPLPIEHIVDVSTLKAAFTFTEKISKYE
jgi:hypothetical protein